MSEAPAGTGTIKEILFKLCSETYDLPFKGAGWETTIDEAIEKLKPFLKTEAQ